MMYSLTRQENSGEHGFVVVVLVVYVLIQIWSMLSYFKSSNLCNHTIFYSAQVLAYMTKFIVYDNS